MSLLSDLIREAERTAKKLVKKNPLIGKLVKFAKGILDVYEAMYPEIRLVETVTMKVQEAEKKFDKKLEGFLTGAERREWVMSQLRKIKVLKMVPDHELLSIIQQVVTIGERKMKEAAAPK